MIQNNDKIPEKEYTSVRLPKDMISEVNQLIEKDKGLGFDSTREFIKESIRANIVKYREIVKSDDKND